ncbi:MAG: hypothetical protein HFE30_01925 [Clostridiales bacterium]|nr:hypothetical protein [Clostridiales bacterium]
MNEELNRGRKPKSKIKEKAESVCLYILSFLLAVDVIGNSLCMDSIALTVSAVSASAVFLILAFCRRFEFLSVTSLIYQMMFVFFVESSELSVSAKASALIIPIILVVFSVYNKRSKSEAHKDNPEKGQKNGAIAAALIAGTVISALLVCYAVYRITLVRMIDDGVQTDNTYASEFADFKYTLPNGWVFIDETQRNEIMNSGDVNYYGDGRLYFVARDIEGINSVYAELLDCGMWTSEERVIRSMISSLESNSGALEYSDASETDSINIGGREYSAVSVTISLGEDDREINVYFIVRTSTRYAVCFTVYSDGTLELSDIADSISEYSED